MQKNKEKKGEEEKEKKKEKKKNEEKGKKKKEKRNSAKILIVEPEISIPDPPFFDVTINISDNCEEQLK